MRVLIAPDKFKGTLTAAEAAAAIADGWKKARPADEIVLLPVTDGGDGFGQVLSELWRTRPRIIHTVDAAHRPIGARWWWDEARKRAIIESAAIIGLAQLPPRRYHPFELDTFGLAKALYAAERAGAKRCLIGIGGSATNDGGFGLARGLDWKFLDRRGKEIERWRELHKLARLKPPQERSRSLEVIVAVDVRNPLLGKAGATQIYGPQKGLRQRDFPAAEQCLRQLATVVNRDLGLRVHRLPGAGAAGGLGFGFASFLGARLEPGFDLFGREAALLTELRRADLVITGEGRLDASSMMGKAAGEILKLCNRFNIRCIALAGEMAHGLKAEFVMAGSLTEFASCREARARPVFWLKRLSQQTAAGFGTKS